MSKRLSKEQAEELLKHCNEFGIHPEICAWYDDMEDFYTDWRKQMRGLPKAY